MARVKPDDQLRETLVDLLKSSMSAKEARGAVNNYYGEAMDRRSNPPPRSGGGGGGGVMSQMGNKAGDDEKDDPFDYWVNIDRTDKYDDKGEKVGWIKNVHRSRLPKGEEPPKKKGPQKKKA
jgi:hypothetical protein